MCGDGRWRAPALWYTAALGLVVSFAASAWFAPRAARAQACCAATGLVIPARLRVYEDFGIGLQARERQSYGSFASDGSFATASSGDLVTEQNLFGLWRALPRLQVGLMIPFIETWRRVSDRSEWGGFFGDVAASARVDVIRPGDYGRFPSVTLLGGFSAPTGRAPDEAHNPLGTDAAGSGSYEGTAGVEIEALWTRWFVSFDGWVAQRTSRAAPGGRQSFDPRVTALVAGGYAFSNQVAVAAFASITRGGGGSLQPSQAASSAAAPAVLALDTRVAVATAGLAGLVPLGAPWRLQGALALDLPLAGWGRNQPATVGLSTSLVRVWP